MSNYRNGTVLLLETLPCQMWLRLCTLHLSEPLAGSQPRVHAPNIKILKIHNAVGRLSNMIICFFVRLAKYIQIQSPWFECQSANLIQFKDNFGNYQWPIPLTENKNVKKGSLVKGHVYQFYHTLSHKAPHFGHPARIFWPVLFQPHPQTWYSGEFGRTW